MYLSTLAVALCLLLERTFAFYVLVPLYVYPGTLASAWQPLFDAIHNHPSVNFQIVINVDTGPGSTALPDANFIAGISQLNSYHNTRLVGYVDTAHAGRTYDAVHNDVKRYAGWSSHKPENISVAGIFFDDVPWKDDGSYMKTVSGYAYTNFTTSGTVIFNPGDIPADASYFSHATTVVEYEDTLANYNGPTVIPKMTAGKHSQIAIIVNEASPTMSRIQTLVSIAKSNNIGGVSLTSDCCYKVLNSTLLSDLAGVVGSS